MQRRGSLLFLEDYIYPVVAAFPALGGEVAAAAVGIDAIVTGYAISQGMQWPVVHPFIGKVVQGAAVVSGIGVVGGHVHGVGGDCYRC